MKRCLEDTLPQRPIMEAAQSALDAQGPLGPVLNPKTKFFRDTRDAASERVPKEELDSELEPGEEWPRQPFDMSYEHLRASRSQMGTILRTAPKDPHYNSIYGSSK